MTPSVGLTPENHVYWRWRLFDLPDVIYIITADNGMTIKRALIGLLSSPSASLLLRRPSSCCADRHRRPVTARFLKLGSWVNAA